MAYVVDVFTPLGIKIVFEAINSYDMPGFIISTSQDMLQILAELSLDNLYVQYDIYHRVSMGESVAEFINQHVDKIGHIQFADYPGRHQPGTGLIDFQKIFSLIDRSAYSGWVGAEYKPIAETINSLSWFK